jgi:vancomycin permeability regulator SanA
VEPAAPHALDAPSAQGQVVRNSRSLRRRLWPWTSLAARTVVFLFGAFALLNVSVTLRHPWFDPNIWWIDLRALPRALDQALMAAAALALIWTSVRPGTEGWRRWLGPSVLLALAGVAAWNSVTFYRTWMAKLIAPEVPIPLSALIAIALVCCAAIVSRPAPRLSRWRAVALNGIVACCFLVLVPLMQMAFFGTTDYRRPADVIVVFGARVDPSGKASIALADRVYTSVQLYKEGLAPVIIMSGGIEPNGNNEAAVMKQLAVSEGVPASAILTDANGFDTQASVNDTTAMFRADGYGTVLAVSHFYHLPRIKLTYARAGYDVLTVPSRDTPIGPNTLIIAREVPAFWLYYLRAATS